MDTDIYRKRREALDRLRATLPQAEQRVASKMAAIRARHCSTRRDDLIKRRVGEMKASLAYSTSSDEDKKRKILFVTGESNSGKTRLIDFASADDPAFRPYETTDGVPAKPLVRVRAPTPCTLRNLAIKILEALGFPAKPDITESRAWPEVERQLRYRRTIFLVIGEAQRMLKVEDEKELQKVSDTLINLVDSDDWPIRLILVGVDLLSTLRTRDKQMNNRSKQIPLGPVAKVERVKQWIIEIVTGHADLTLEEGFDGEECARKCIHACVGNAGSIIELIQGAVENTLNDNRDIVELADFAQAYHDITSCLPHDNVFDVKSWQQVPEGAARLADSDQDGDEPAAASKPMKFGERPR